VSDLEVSLSRVGIAYRSFMLGVGWEVGTFCNKKLIFKIKKAIFLKSY